MGQLLTYFDSNAMVVVSNLAYIIKFLIFLSSDNVKSFPLMLSIFLNLTLSRFTVHCHLSHFCCSEEPFTCHT